MTPAATDVWLRLTTADDLTVLYDFQADPVAAEMAAFPSRDWPTYLAHQTGVIADPSTVKMTVMVGTEVAGDIGCWGEPDAREIGYWIGRGFWGRHVATDALRLFLDVVPDRPLHGYVVPSNPASQKVLLSCGFVQTGVDGDHLAFTLS
jgi:RimJ/RimL family protein N-acetyltransferase